ncbi:MAG: hypothetical protein M3R44_06035 [Candidatus Eremiobacteraeota bacterium]|nr:hypothetical protein [Candidatus Eremiobacteraeota bacterium]
MPSPDPAHVAERGRHVNELGVDRTLLTFHRPSGRRAAPAALFPGTNIFAQRLLAF